MAGGRSHLSVTTFVKFFDHLAIERGDVVRFAAGNESIVDHDFLVDPVATRVSDVCLNRGPRCKCSATDHAGVDQNPWSMTNGGNRFAFFEKVTREFECLGG